MKLNRSTSLTRPPHPEDDTVTARLAELDAFPEATPQELHEIVHSGTVVSIPEGWSLIWEKTPADKAYVVLEGTASVQHDHVEVARIGAGEFVGELALVRHRLRSATVVAATPLWVLHFTREAVERLRLQVPSFGERLEQTAAGRAT